MEIERTLVFATPSPAQARAMQTINAVFEAAKEAVKPGALVKSIDWHGECWEKPVYCEFIWHGSGHARGILTGSGGREELGELRVYNDTLLAPGMVTSSMRTATWRRRPRTERQSVHLPEEESAVMAIETAATRTTASATLRSIDPATGEVVGEVRVTPVEEIPSVVRRARAAQKSWAGLTLQQRADAIAAAGSRLLARTEDLALLITREMGKPLTEATGEVRWQIGRFGQKLEEIIDALQPESVEDENTQSIIYREPFGVCAAITPWNYPLDEPLQHLVPALMAGNAVILKPSEETPMVAQTLVDILNTSLPRDIVQVVHGADEQGKALVAAEGVELIAFTGSREAGKHILAAASKSLKRVILELGGKDPMIVLSDADLDAAADFAVGSSFRNAGQMCNSTERIYVDAEIAEEFEQRVAKRAASLKIGPGTRPDVDLGPMVHRRQKQWVLQQIEEAKRQGAKVVLDGASASGGDDNFVKPTVLSNVNHDMEIMREETFGPVACIARFTSVDEAVTLANNTPYGLGAVVFGRDETRAAEVARRLEAGMIGVNKKCGGARGTPWVGAKESGYGWHSGKEGHRQFAQPRVVSLPKST